MVPAVLYAFFGTLVLTPLALHFLPKLGAVDHPGPRSLHNTPTARGGGLAPAVVCLSLGLFSGELLGSLRPGLLMAAGGFALLGLAEDFRGVSVKLRLLSQLLVAAGAGQLLLAGDAPVAAVFFAAVAAVWLISYLNAFNFMDGINGISAVQVVVAGLTWAVVGTRVGSPELTSAGLIVAAAAAGFAPFNFPRARVFLGDVGSYFFGGWLGAVVVWGIGSEIPPEALLAPLALYLADTATTLIKRAVRGENLMSPHREHAYQRLVIGGWTHRQVDALVGGTMLACALFGVASLGSSIPLRVAGDLGIGVVLAAYLASPALVARRRAKAQAQGTAV